MEISIFNNYGNISFEYKKIVTDISDYFSSNYQVTEEVSLILVNLEEIKNINNQYRHLDYPTDVISFEDKTEDYLGDIFICIDKLYEQAQTYEHPNEREFAFLLTHGILHLLGYDHLTKADEEIMFNLQEEILYKTNYRRINNG